MSERVLLLGVDTSGEGDLAVAELLRGELHLCAERRLHAGSASVELLPRLEEILWETGIRLGEIACLVVVQGPGSFTGTRIGLSAVKGLAEANGTPVIGVSSLEVLAGEREDALVVIEAGRGETYVRLPGGSERTMTYSEVAEAAQSAATVVADSRTAQLLGLDATPREDRSLAALRVALPRFLAGAFDDLAMLDANYVRRPYTEQKST